jgi:hypothetical protein
MLKLLLMRQIITLLFPIIALTGVVKGQRLIETVLDPANSQQQNTVFGGRVLIAGQSDTFLLAYNDASFTRYNYPVISSSRLRFNTSKNPLVNYKSAVYFGLLRGTTVVTTYLYRFTGSSFTNIPIPGNLVGGCIVYGENMYFLCMVSGVVKLFRYNGATVSEVAGSSMPNAGGYALHVTEGYLYISGYQYYTGTFNFIKRFNGSSFFTLPYSGPAANVENAYGVPGTTRVYFSSRERIIYFNGTSVTQVYYNVGESHNAVMWRSNLYFTTGVGYEPGRINYLYRLSGASLTEITLPAGARVAATPNTNPAVYNDRLYVGAVYTDGTKRVLRYDGTSFTNFFDIAVPVPSGIYLFVRKGDLIIHPNFVNGNRAFEYDGSVFTQIDAPADRLLFPYINSTNCKHLWLNYYSTPATPAGFNWAYGAENECPPPTPPAVVIPEHFKDYERFDMTTYGPERGWCWSEIIIDWDIVPYCPLPPCPDANYQARMTDINNAIAWAANFNKPSSFTVPLPDLQPYRTILASTDAQKDLLIFEPDLVPAGIASFTVNMKPKQHYLLLSATTRNNAQVPVKATLKNAKGTVLWEQTFTAPFSQQINATVQEPGQVLIFSKADQLQPLITLR